MAELARKVLVVEDEPLVAMLIEDALSDAGYEVLGPASSVAEALRLLGSLSPDAVVLDLNLGGENSVPVADAAAARAIPYVIATGYGAAGLPPGHRHAALLAKPYDPAELTRMLGRFWA